MRMPRCILVVGGGGREHALAWSLARSPAVQKVYVAPGNGGTAREPKVENVPLADHNVPALLRFASEQAIDLTVVGPELPLAQGIVDAFRAQRLAIFGPTAGAARLESSKSWARDFMARYNIPHPRYFVAEDPETARRAAFEMDGRCAVKADGLAGGKGVTVCREMAEAELAIRSLMVEQRFGPAGQRLLIEEVATGQELSVMAAVDGKRFVLFPPAQDYKRLLEGDTGPNTGGMGSYSPPPIATPEFLDRVRDQVIEPTVWGLAHEGEPFTGCLYCGLMQSASGPLVIEYNVRFGDPESQAQLPLVGDSLLEVLDRAAASDLGEATVATDEGQAAVCVVLAAPGYPEKAQTGAVVHGLEAAEDVPGVKVFHAGTQEREGQLVTSGGRVLGVVCVREGLADAVVGAYAAIGPRGVHFDDMQYRRDIAARAIASQPPI